MAIIIYILTILLAVATFFIIKNKRYKVVPLVSWVIIIFFIGCVFISIVSLFVPYGEILVLPLGSIVLGFVVILAAFNDFYSLIRCKDKIEKLKNNLSKKNERDISDTKSEQRKKLILKTYL